MAGVNATVQVKFLSSEPFYEKAGHSGWCCRPCPSVNFQHGDDLPDVVFPERQGPGVPSSASAVRLAPGAPRRGLSACALVPALQCCAGDSSTIILLHVRLLEEDVMCAGAGGNAARASGAGPHSGLLPSSQGAVSCRICSIGQHTCHSKGNHMGGASNWERKDLGVYLSFPAS